MFSSVSSYPRTQLKSTAVLVAPDPDYRLALTRAVEARNASIVTTLTSYPTYNQTVALVEQECDCFIIEIDSDTDAALDLVELICTRKPLVTVMVYAHANRPELLVASMRAGAREFLTGVVDPNTLSEALLRAAARRAETTAKKTQGKLVAFCGAKGGTGVTTLAVNFAIALRQETGGEVALLELNSQLGDIPVLLGITPRFTVADAFLNPARLDEEFISTLVTSHRTGVSVIAAADTYTSEPSPDPRTVGRLLELVTTRYPYVVVDAGGGMGKASEPLFETANTIYMVAQPDIPSLRNTQRFLTYLANFGDKEIELVLNRYEPRKVEFDDERLAKAVGMPPKWKVPNDFAAARRAANTGTPLLAEKSAVVGVLQQMARAASGKLPETDKKRSFRLFS